jgi:ATP-binding cassette, subfamily B, multidrug efflux pump
MKHLKSLNKYFWKYRWLFMLGIVFVVLTNYFRILAPQITGYVLNTVVHAIKKDGADKQIQQIAGEEKNYDFLVKKVIVFFENHPDNKILLAGITLLILAIISGFFMFLMRQTIIVMSRHIEYNQKNEIFNHYQKLDTNFYKTHSTGDLMNRISEDVSRVRMYTGPAIMYFINLAAVIGFSVFFMLKASKALTLVALAPLPILAITIFFVNTIINKKSEKIQALLSSLTTNAQESYSGIRVIKSYVQEKAMLLFFKDNSEAYRNNALSLAKTEAIYFPSMALLIGLSTIITIMVGCLSVINKTGDITVGTIAEFVLYIQMLTFPVSAIGWTASMTQRAAASQKRINEFLHTEPEIKNEIQQHDKVKHQSSPFPSPPTGGRIGGAKPVLQGNISLTNVDFTYAHTGINAIKNFSLQINKGEKVAIIGRTGSGKSTIAQLLLHMYNPQSGIITYDGTPINKIDIDTLREQISYVPQDVFLFSETVSNNISFGLKDASEETIITAAKQASVHNEILKFKQQYQTMIGERGVTLSGGQKQRISIARALIKNPQIVIFDDCLSAVDARTEKEIIENLYNYLQNKTALIITHRIFSLFKFDKIIVLEQGRIAEEGTHDELLAKNGIYTEMYNRQQTPIP